MSRYPEHHEGITGTGRTGDWLLSLDDQARAHRDTLIVMARHLAAATLVGRPAPVVQAIWTRISNPQPGDLVVEHTRALYAAGPARADDRLKGLGYFLGTRAEWADTEADWRERCEEARRDYPGNPEMVAMLTSEEENRATARPIYIQYGPDPGDVCRWTDAAVYVLPVDVADFHAVAGTRDGTGITLTRPDLTDVLFDVGIRVPEQRRKP